MKYTADCPACENAFDIPLASHAAHGLRCPACGTGFVPDKIHEEETAEEIKWGQEQRELQMQRDAHAEKWRDYEILKQNASIPSRQVRADFIGFLIHKNSDNNVLT